MDKTAALAAMFAPKAVAHVGASEQGLYPADIFKCLMQSDTELFAVNPNRDAVFGKPCYRSLKELPRVPELVVVTVPRQFVHGVLEECVAVGSVAAVVISSGFAEADDQGRELERGFAAFRDKLIILGPNCAGFANLTANIAAMRLSYPKRAGGISFVAQSGALMMSLYGAFYARGAGMRHIVSVGNQADLSVEDFLMYFAQDTGTRVSAAFIEGIRDGRKFIEALKAHARAGKAVVLVKSGRTAVGQKLAATHTAAAAGDAKIFEAVCRQYGAIVVDDLEDMISTALLFDYRAGSGAVFATHVGSPGLGIPVKDNGIAWVSQSGGLGSLTGDLAKNAGLEPRLFPAEIEARIKELGLVPAYQNILNPVDLRGDLTRGYALGDSLKPFLESPDIDTVVLLFAKNPNRAVETETAACILELRKTYSKTIVVVWVGRAQPQDDQVSAIDILIAGGVPVFSQSGDAVRALARIARHRAFVREVSHARIS